MAARWQYLRTLCAVAFSLLAMTSPAQAASESVASPFELQPSTLLVLGSLMVGVALVARKKTK